MSRNPAARLLLLAGTCLLVAAPAFALPITYEVESGIGYSGLGAADKSLHLGNLFGEITLDYDADGDAFSFLHSSVWLDSKEYSFEIVDFELRGDGAGRMDFSLVGTGEYAQAGSFFFQGGEPVCCGPDGPNYGTPARLRLFGVGNAGDESKASPVEIDFVARSASPMPEPSAAVVFAAGALLCHGALRRRSA